MSEILLIEPDKPLAEMYQAALKKAGVAVRWARSAQNAISAIDAHVPKLIVLEMQLAAHNGVEFLHELRSYHDLQDIPVIIVSVVPQEDLGLSEENKTQLGIAKYYYKPQLKLEKLVESVKDIIR